MNASNEKAIDVAPAHKPVSVYNLSFGRDLVTEQELAFLMERSRPRKFVTPDRPKNPAPRRTIPAVLNGRNLGLFGAILAVAAMHFLFQLYFIRTESGAPAEAVGAEVGRPFVPVVAEPTAPADPEFAVRRISADDEPNYVPAPVLRRSAPVRNRVQAPAPRRENPESRAARLRRAERLLTGI